MDSLDNARDGALRRLQLTELEGLLELRRLCRDNGLRYYLTGGSLLGAVRHRGFIPWDDDIDVAMPRDDYERFSRICREEGALRPGYRFQSEQTDPSYPHCFGKFFPPGGEPGDWTWEEHIDVFPLDRCPEGKALGALYFAGMRLLNNALLARLDAGFVCEYKRRYMRLVLGLVRRLPTIWLRRLRRAVRKVFDRLSSDRLVCNVGGVYGFPGEVCQRSWFDGTAELDFEGQPFSVPTGWDALLRNMYGDYMTPVPEEERHGHHPGG